MDRELTSSTPNDQDFPESSIRGEAHPACVEWIQERCCQLLDISPTTWADDNTAVATYFLVDNRTVKCFAYCEPDTGALMLVVATPPSLKADSVCAYFIKDTVEYPSISPENIASAIRFGNVRGTGLDSMLRAMHHVFAPPLLRSKVWPESIQKDYASQLHRSLASLTEHVHRMDAKTVLYVPIAEEIDDIRELVKDKEKIQRLEVALIYWTRQIKEVLAEKDTMDASDAEGPLAEIEFWRMKAVDLANICNQLERPDVLKIVAALEASDSRYYLEPFQRLSSQISSGSAEALDNLRYLRTLRGLCEELAKAAPRTIPTLLRPLLRRIQMIFLKSGWYNTPERLVGLLRKVSSEITARCCQYIDVAAIFDGRVDGAMKVLRESVTCGVEWKYLCTQLLDACRDHWQKTNAVPWQLDTTAVFAEVDAFVHQRCKDILEVCEGQLQFGARHAVKSSEDPGASFDSLSGGSTAEGSRVDPNAPRFPVFGGAKGPDIEKALYDMHTLVKRHLDQLWQYRHVILDVKATRWHDIYTEFRRGLKDLEVMLVNTIASAFDSPGTVEHGVELIDAFDSLAKRAAVERAVANKARDVYQLFLREEAVIRQQFGESRRDPPIAAGLPPYAGRAVWAAAFKGRLEITYSHLQLASFTPMCPERREAEQSYTALHAALDSYISQTYEEWKNSLPAKPTMYLEQPLIMRNVQPNGVAFFEVNFAPELVILLEEARQWRRLGSALPSVAFDLLVKEERMRVLYENVAQAVREYNAIVFSLSTMERRLFGERIAAMDRKYSPATGKLSWSSKGIVEYFVRQARQHCAELQMVVTAFKEAVLSIRRNCSVLSETFLVSIEKKVTYTEAEFERRQREHRDVAHETLRSAHQEIIETMKSVYVHFMNDGEEIQAEWQAFVQSVEKDIDTALRTTVKRSLLELLHAVMANPSGGAVVTEIQQPLFLVSVELKGVRPDLIPNVVQLKELMTGVSTDLIGTINGIPRVEDALADWAQSAYERGEGPPPVGGPTEKASLFEDISNDNEVIRILVDIVNSTMSVQEQVTTYLMHWEPHSQLYSVHKEKFIARFAKANRPLGDYEVKIQDAKDAIGQVVEQDTMTVIRFLKLDCSRLKDSLKEHGMEWQRLFFDLLNTNAKSELDDLYRYFSETRRTLSTVPKDLKQMSSFIQILDKFSAEQAAIHARFEPLDTQYALLERYEVSIRDEELDQLAKLPDVWDGFKSFMAESAKKIERYKDQFRLEVETDLKQMDISSAQLREKFAKYGPYGDNLHPDVAMQILAEYREKIKEKLEKTEVLKEGLDFFGVAKQPGGDLIALEQEISTCEAVWALHRQWQSMTLRWDEIPFRDVVVDDIAEVVAQNNKEIQKLSKKIGHADIWKATKAWIDKLRRTLPMITDLRNDAMRDRHWQALQAELETRFDWTSDKFTMSDVTALDLDKHHEFIGNLSLSATSEMVIEQGLIKIREHWEGTVLSMEPYRSDHHRIMQTDDLFTSLDEHNLLLGQFKISRYVQPFEQDVLFWEQNLGLIAETVETLLTVQTKWMYIESIFLSPGSDDMQKQMPADAQHFSHVNLQWASLTQRMSADPNVLRITRRENLLDLLNDMVSKLEKIQKLLEEYLETRRRAFPRFYFLSNDDLLEILGRTREPERVEPHLKKCFEGLHTLQLKAQPRGGGQSGVGPLHARGMGGFDGEQIPFVSPVLVEGLPVEAWLSSVEDQMKTTVRRALAECYRALRKPGRDIEHWLKSHNGQALITSAQVQWTAEVEAGLSAMASAAGGGSAMRKNPVHTLWRKWRQLIQAYCRIIRMSRLSSTDRNKLVALITIEVHARDVLERLYSMRVASPNSFVWSSQLRFYLESDADGKAPPECIVRQTSAVIPYDNEYVGNSGRLVVTPLTDRCYMTLTTALRLSRGGQPQGPAGTGKTETVKDLGKSIGKYVIVFNCSEGLDYASLGRMFSGLCQTGAWSCFDEFNRIDIEVLSVVAQQILTILTALFHKETSFMFEGREISLNPGCGIFVTMNPGYAGRSELPDNLKALLRPVSMMVPDNVMICEIVLLSQGFSNSEILAKKIAQLYELMSQQLSKQDHYDFGLRNVKSVLVRAGHLKRVTATAAAAAAAASTEPQMDAEGNVMDEQQRIAAVLASQQTKGAEEALLLKACRDMNAPRFVAEDVPLFDAMLGDLFPGVELPSEDQAQQLLREALKEELVEAGLQTSPIVLLKGLELFETKRTRHGVMCVGNTCTGKTTTWRNLAGAMKRLATAGEQISENVPFEPVRPFLLNPKSVTIDELYGIYNFSTREWKDGILSSIMRNVCSQATTSEKWIVFDAPVDTLWIESMNTVLDDNKLLTLNSGERIALPASVSLLFETQDLGVASPATVSRCGMVYFDFHDLGWRPVVDSWLKQRKDYERRINAPKPTETVDMLRGLFDSHMDLALSTRRKDCDEIMPQHDLQCVRGLCNLFDAIVCPEHGLNVADTAEVYRQTLAYAWSFCLVWMVGGSVTAPSRRRFDVLVRDLEPSFPSADTVYEYYFDLKSKSWEHWEARVPGMMMRNETPIHKLVVPTIDTVRYSYIVGVLVKARQHVLVCGASGTGKTTAVSLAMSNLDDTSFAVRMNFSAQTSSGKVQEMVESKLDRRSKKTFSPPGGKRMVCVVEDINMPLKDQFGSQPPLELLRLWIDTGFWYDREKQTRRQISEVQLLGLMSYGRQPLPQRMLSKFCTMNITFPAEPQVISIFNQMLSTGFVSDESRGLIDMLVSNTIDLHNHVLAELRPTPAKPHYLFNMRHLSNVFTGMLRAGPEECSTREQCIILWLHECQRVFGDRLCDAADKAWFRAQLNEQLTNNFSVKWATLLKDARNPCFVDFLDADRFDDDKVYKEVSSMALVRTHLETMLKEYNNEPGVRPLSLIFFGDAIDHLCHVYNLITAPRGHALLVGIGGSGRSSLTRLATYLAGYDLFTLEITKHYGPEAFREDLKSLYRRTGKQHKSTVLLVSDSQLVHPSFLEDINSLLATGDVPNLYTMDELTQIREEMRTEAMTNRVSADTVESVYQFYVECSRDFLHVVLCVSPVGTEFRNRVRQFPALVSATGVDWFTEWPATALKQVAAHEFQTMNLGSKEMTQNVEDMVVMIHRTAGQMANRMLKEIHRYFYVTPTNYLELVSGYQRLVEEKRREYGTQVSKLKGGLEKLETTKEQVQVMSVRLEEQKRSLAQANQDCDALLSIIQQEKRIADEKRLQIETDKVKIARESEHAAGIAAEAAADLERAMPELLEAEKALATLRKSDIDEIKAYKSPAELIVLVLNAVQVTLKRTPSWPEAQKSMGENFLKTLLDFDKSTLTDSLLNKIARYIQNPKFDPNLVGTVSFAAKGLCSWVIAIHRYGLVNKEVMPKILKQKRATDELNRKERMLQNAVNSLEEVVQKVEMLQVKTDEKLAEQERLRQQAENTQRKLQRAEMLVGGLGGERERWTESIGVYELRMHNIVGDALLAAGFLSYAGPFNSTYRQELLSKWLREVQLLQIPCSKGFTPVGLLSEPTLVREWHLQGLPGDDFSTENGVIVTRGIRWPLMIDPQGQANKWIRAMEGRELQIVDMKQPDYMRVIEHAIQQGQSVLIQDVLEELDPTLEPVLSRAIVRMANRNVIMIGDTAIDYHPDFKLYLSTKLGNPHYSPEICTKTALVNFMVKEQGLEEQLLKIMVGIEKRDLEEKKDAMIRTVAANLKQTKELEDTILQLLSEADETLLEDEALINTLQNSKSTAQNIEKQAKEHEVMEVKINAAREQYRPCAHRASLLFFVLSDLGLVDPMYQFSLGAYTNLFELSIRKSAENVRTDSVTARVKTLNEWHTLAVYNNTCRAIMERHKLLFSFLMTVRVMETLSTDEFAFFLRGGVVLDRDAQPPNLNAGWVSNRAWDNITELDKLQAFHGIVASFETMGQQWKELYSDPTPEDSTLPGEWQNKLDPFQRMMLIRCIRPDRVTFMATRFVASELGRRYTEPPPFNLQDVYDDSAPTLPIIFILSPGVDPTTQLQALATKAGRTLHVVALGQGQESAAKRLIHEQSRNGGWVFLANCHLMMSWLPKLEQEIADITRPHERFRLWLSSTPHERFPISILQQSIKITTEPPAGVRANMLRMFSQVTDDVYTSSHHPLFYRPLFFALCFFHSVLLERRKFGTLGLNIPYDFNDSDFEVSESILRIYIQNLPDNARPDSIPFPTIRYLVADATYGGRVTDDFDRRLISVYAEQYLCENAVHDAGFVLAPVDGYLIPSLDGMLMHYKDFVSQWPTDDAPEVLGQHPNADISSMISQSNQLLATLVTLNRTVLAAADDKKRGQEDALTAKKSKDEDEVASAGSGGAELRVLTTAKDILDRLPQKIEYESVLSSKEDERGSALVTVLLQEILRYNALITLVNDTLALLMKGIRGLVVMDEHLDSTYESVLIGTVPVEWLRAYPSLKPLASWVRDLTQRVDTLLEWGMGQQPKVFWLGGFMYPTGFLMALRQQAARQQQISIDQFEWDFQILHVDDTTITSSPRDGAYVRGIYLEGGGWDDDRVCLTDPKPMQLVVSMPIIHFKPVTKESAQARAGERDSADVPYSAPLYMYPVRTGTRERPSFVTCVDLPSGSQSPDHWIRRGTALLLATDT